jgi:hypothetical protein
MTTKTTTRLFAPAIKAAKSLDWTHARIRHYGDRENRKRFICSLYSAGRIDVSAKLMLLDLYVDEC